tara:strand:+ start:103 stop:582 length:480 start_codon:yes stop_codon:yes gene_type:complete
MLNFFTIGVYGSIEDVFFQKLITNNIHFFCDIRHRRGVRGSKYSFVNSIRLQNRLIVLNIKYKHLKDLGPSKEIRALQIEKDTQNSESKKSRKKLAKAFIEAYKEIFLNPFNLNKFVDFLTKEGHKNIVLFCVEEKYLACHRSIVSDRLKELGHSVQHL